MQDDVNTYRMALNDFRRARSKAALQRFWAGIRGNSLDLVPYEEISSKLRTVSQTERGLQQVPLDKIIGSVGRVFDFDREFRPLRDSDITRWANVKTAMTSPAGKGVPPVSLYKVSDAYFVLDGNHRVSIAKEMGLEDIEAYVTELSTKVPISSSITSEELVKKAAYVNFLEETRLDVILPGVDFSLNLIENYDLLKEHVQVHRYYMGIEQQREIPYEEAVLHWYDQVYLPVIELIKSSGLILELRELTITDLYLWALDQQSNIQKKFGMEFQTENAMEYAAKQQGKLPKANLSKSQLMLDEILHADYENSDDDPFNAFYRDCLFKDILVAISNSDPDWIALEQAILINRCSAGTVRGLHVIQEDDLEKADLSENVHSKFENRLSEAGIQGKMFFSAGNISNLIKNDSLLSDLVVMKLTYPPVGGIVERFTSGIVRILDESRRSIMFVKEKALPLDHILLVYDGSANSKEALFISAYMTARYQNRLTVLITGKGEEIEEELINSVSTYLEKLDVPYIYFQQGSKSSLATINQLIEDNNISTLILGGSPSSSVFDKIFGTTFYQLLDLVDVPILICY